MLSVRQHSREDRAQGGVYSREDFSAAEHPCWAALGHKNAVRGQRGLDHISVEVLSIQLHQGMMSAHWHLSDRGPGRGGRKGEREGGRCFA